MKATMRSIEYGAGRRLGETGVFHAARQGSAQAPNLGSRASLLGHSYMGQLITEATVGGEILFPRHFVMGTHEPRLLVHVRAMVEGDLRFSTNRSGLVGGTLAVWLDGYIGGTFEYNDASSPGGLGRKAIIVSAATAGDLTVRATGRANFCDFALTVYGVTEGMCTLKGNGICVLMDTISPDGNREIVVGDSN